MADEGGAGGFFPLSPGKKGQRAAAESSPGSNTGQKGQQDAIIDYLTIVVPLSAFKEENFKRLDLHYKLVATPWPRQAPRREEDPTLYRLDKPDTGIGIATAGSEAGAGIRVISAQGAVSTAGGTPVRVCITFFLHCAISAMSTCA